MYGTDEPRAAFHARIAFCLDIHNEAVKVGGLSFCASLCSLVLTRSSFGANNARERHQTAEECLAALLRQHSHSLTHTTTFHTQAMRFDPDAHKRQETEEERSERLAAEAELAAALAEDDGMMDDDF